MDNPGKHFVQVLNESDINLNSVCRLCFSSETELVSIASHIRSADSTVSTALPDLVNACVQQEIIIDDEYPQHVCHNCLNFLVGWAEFKDKCEKTKELLKNWCSIKMHLENIEGDDPATDGTFEIKNNIIKAAGLSKKNDNSNENEDYWILVVGDGTGAKKIPAQAHSDMITCNRVNKSNLRNIWSKHLQSSSSKPLSSIHKKVVTFSPDVNKKEVKQLEPAWRKLQRIRPLGSQNNGHFLANTDDLEPEDCLSGNDNITEIRSAGDLLRKTSFVSDDDGDSNTSESTPLTSDTAVDRIQKLIDKNETILKTSAVKVRRAHKGFKSAAQHQAKSSNTAKDSPSTVKVPPNILRKNAQESRKRKRSRGPQHNIAYQQNIVSCDVCGESFYNYESLLHHDQTSHDEYPRLFSCSACDQEFLTEDHRNLHTISYHGTESSSDDEGPDGKLVVRLRGNLSQLSAGAGNGLRSFICGICNESFTSAVGLRRHLITCENSVLLV